MAENKLYYGDNLDIVRRYIADESVALIYLDPPFKSQRDYNVLFAERNGTMSKAQVKAFEDTWTWDLGSQEAYEEFLDGAPSRACELMRALHSLLGHSDMMAYLAMMAPRLVELSRVLKPTGSIYLHCDATASHYLKLLMDAVFGPLNFRDEITWTMHGIGRKRKIRKFPVDTQRLLFYTKSGGYTFNEQSWEDRIPKRLHGGEMRLPPGYSRDERGRVYWTSPRGDYTDESVERLRAEGRVHETASGKVRIKYFARETEDAIIVERAVTDSWADIPDILRRGSERTGYPTQKPEPLLERIILGSSNEGDTVLDPFCGCGTAVVAAHRWKRRWIGIDITHLAVTLIRHSLQQAFGDAVTYDVVGEPVSITDAQELAVQNRFQFQWWALGLVGARPADSEKRKGADKGVDGRLYFHDEPEGGKTKQIVLSVKSGSVSVRDVRDLQAVVGRENAEIGVLITLGNPTRDMRLAAADAGFYQSPGWGTRYPRLQIVAVEELLGGKRVEYPPRTNVTFNRAARTKGNNAKQNELPGVGDAP